MGKPNTLDGQTANVGAVGGLRRVKHAAQTSFEIIILRKVFKAP